MARTYKHKPVYLAKEGERYSQSKNLKSVLYVHIPLNRREIIRKIQMFTHEELLRTFRKGLRNGNWRKLHRAEKALYMASLWYARVRGAIMNETLVGMLSVLVDKLKATKGARIFKRGYEKAVELLSKGEGIFAWAPSLRKWLKDPDYVFWLGAGGLRIDR